jgi:hypothetical protein
MATTLVITSLHHDFSKNRSFVTVTWKDDPEKRLGLPVPLDCSREQIKAEAHKAILALAKELQSASID